LMRARHRVSKLLLRQGRRCQIFCVSSGHLV
jgi:hypothetical protein